MVIPFVVPEILGGVEPPPQMPLSCQKRQMPLTVKNKSVGHQTNRSDTQPLLTFTLMLTKSVI